VAGEQALAVYAYEEALVHFERGLAARDIALSGTEAASQAALDDKTAALLFGLARARSATRPNHQLQEAFSVLSRAFEYYFEAGNVALAVAAAEFPIALLIHRIPGVSELLARALTMVPADSHEAGRLLSRYGGILGCAEGDYDGAQQALRRAIAIARRVRDVVLEVQTLTYAAAVSGYHLHYQESVDHGLAAIALSSGDENPLSRWWTAFSLLSIGNLDAARPSASVLRELGERPSTSRSLAGGDLLVLTMLSGLEGDWKSGREFSGWGLELLPMSASLLSYRVLLEHQTEESAQGEIYLERLLNAMGSPGPEQHYAPAGVASALATVSRITGVNRRLAIAESAAQTYLSEQPSVPSRSLLAKVGLALLAVQKEDQTAAAEHYDHLLGQRGTMIDTVTSADRLLGLLSQTMGNFDQAVGHFEDALAFCRKAGYRRELAWTCCDYADMLLVGARHAVPLRPDRGKAVVLLDESLTIATELGMPPLMERVTQRLQGIQVPPKAAPAYPDGLTAREVEVLRLIAAGSTNFEIAGDLVIAEGTARRHVVNIYEKIGAANRAEATRYALREGILALDENGPTGG